MCRCTMCAFPIWIEYLNKGKGNTSMEKEILRRFALDDRTAVITGGGKGIGKAIALGFAQNGANVVVAEIDAEAGRSAVAQIQSDGGTGLAIPCDVLDKTQVSELMAETLGAFGRLDILVNNVGATRSTPRRPIFDIEEERWDFIVDLNLKTTFLCAQAAAKIMKAQNSGNIINITSGAGLRPYPGQLPYGAAKAGVVNFTQSLAVHLAAYNIRVNAIAPGTIVTPGMAYLGDMDERTRKRGVPLSRAGRAEDIAMAAIYLASDASNYTTGVTLPVAGGPYLGGIMMAEAEEGWQRTKDF